MTAAQINVDDHRKPDHDIETWIYHRWSPRSMSGESLSDEEIASLFEAARWAPSSYNGQPWRFYYAKRDTEHWQRLFDLMVEFNQGWAQHAGLLIVITSRKTFEHNGKPALTHSFDTGAAAQNLALQGTAMGLVVHAMQGFDYEAAHQSLGLPDDVAVEAMMAVGRPATPRDKETPNSRKPISEIAFEGTHKD